MFLNPEGRITKKELIDFILKETEGFSDEDLVSSIHMRFLMIGKATVREIPFEQIL
ncbi:hypothetical protein M091_4584 [Parabacteroides distasonis str. 3776 D15 i]|uniref:Uncharacterized protein n=1 Tax=Parabacteroides distasonis str. 3776 D15 i TaxID=1339342 RepID=A0AB34LIJ6_PARDI|nr:hypothetical protein M091_4584 [Parabacteroides distasonis str. 3776 D15 i]